MIFYMFLHIKKIHICALVHPYESNSESALTSQLSKVPKREIFVSELITLSDPIWKHDLRTEPKNQFV